MKSSLRVILMGGIDPDARGWANRVAVAGGTVSGRTVRAVSTFTRQAKAAGIWDKLNRVNLFCGDQLAAALVPLKVGAGTATDTNVNFVGGDYTEATGITGNGSTKYLNTGLVPSTAFTLNNTHLAVYNRAGSAVGGGRTMGVSSGGSFAIYAPLSDGSLYSDQYASGAGRVTAAVAAPYGLMVGSRTSATSHAIYRQGALVASNATMLGALSPLPVFVFAWNLAGVASDYTSHPLSAYSVGSGLTAAEIASYSTIMEGFQDALGRGVQ